MSDTRSVNHLRTPGDLVSGFGEDRERQLVALEAVCRAERQLAVSSIASMIAHFIGTPLNVIVGRAGLIRRNPEATDAIVKDAVCIQQKVEQVTEKLRSFIDLLAPRSSGTECDPQALVTEAVELYRPIARVKSIDLVIRRAGRELPQVKRHPTFAVLTSLLSLSIQEVPPSCAIELGATLAGDSSSDTTLEFTLAVPGCLFDDPRQLARFEKAPVRSEDGLQVLGIYASVARKAGGQLLVRNCESNSELVLRWPSFETGF